MNILLSKNNPFLETFPETSRKGSVAIGKQINVGVCRNDVYRDGHAKLTLNLIKSEI